MDTKCRRGLGGRRSAWICRKSRLGTVGAGGYTETGQKRVLFRPATGGCAGLYALGDFQALARGEPFR